MNKDPEYEEIPQSLRAMSEHELVTEERLARDALIQDALKHLHEPNIVTLEGLAAELRLIEAQLALNIKVRDNTIQAQLAAERAKGQLTPEAEQLIH